MTTTTTTDKEALLLCQLAEETFANPRPTPTSFDERMAQDHELLGRLKALTPKLAKALRERIN